ncbi:hypothetical protein [Halorientalis salina]|uniref:hypothetical protein n=1 Tax=Halorientalis salina TaxID=2932266 RepID=UPI0010AC9613|nr:hypothetical protein [Halorientalis salina]
MASEPSDDPVSISLPPELAEWVDQQAADRDTDRETVLVQLLAAHQATEELEDGADFDADVLARTTDLEDEVRNIIADRLSDIAGAVTDRIDIEQQVGTALDERLDDRIAAAVDEELPEALEEDLPEAIDKHLAAELDERLADAIEDQLGALLEDRLAEVSQSAAEQASRQIAGEIESVESEFTGKVEDVRDRVIQVKKETDRKAPADHEHPDVVDRIEDVETDIEGLVGEIEDVEADLDGRLDAEADRLDDVEETVADVQEKLRTVAYVVKELRENSEVNNKRATSIEAIKRAAAEHDVDRAQCEACGQGVSVALMTDPECPHCKATVTDVEPSDGFFGKPQLVKAQGIEAAGDEEEG